MTIHPQPQRLRLSTCHRHPSQSVTGFCASCLRERLSTLESSSAGTHTTTTNLIPSSTCSSSLPELRRSKSFSVGKRDGSSAPFEPQRKSCDVRARSTTLWSLFNLDDQKNGLNTEFGVETRNLGFLEKNVSKVLESREQEEQIGGEIRGIDEEFEEGVELKTMKEHIDLEWQNRKQIGLDFKDIAGSFWVAASVFSKKLCRWRGKQKLKRRHSGCGGDRGGGLVAMEVEKLKERQLRETQSEIADYGFGRRSCDTDPRFSIDGERISFDEPRASWDGYLMGRRLTPMVSVVENASVRLRGNDNGVLVEENVDSVNEEESPGGSAQTRDYYLDSSRRGRRSFEGSGSNRKVGLVEVDEMKSISNAKVSPTTLELFHGAKLLITERDLSANSVKDDCSESLDSASKDAASVVCGGDRKGFKKGRRWHKAWAIWDLIHKRSESKYEDVVGGSPVEPWVKQGREVNGEAAKGADSDRNGSVNSGKMDGSLLGVKSGAGIKGRCKKRREHVVLERNRSARYSPNHLDNGLLRFYLTPLRSSRSKCGKSRLKNSHSIARNVLRLY